MSEDSTQTAPQETTATEEVATGDWPTFEDIAVEATAEVNKQNEEQSLSDAEIEKLTKSEEDQNPDLVKKEAKTEEKTDSSSKEISEKQEEQGEKDAKRKGNEEGVHEVVLNGEKVEVTLQDLKNAYSGKKEIDKRFTELDKERKEWQDEKSQVEGYIAEFGNRVKDGNIMGGLAYFADFAGIPAYLLKEQLIAAITPEIQSRANMTQEEISNQLLKGENDFLQQRNESERERNTKEQARLQSQQAERDLKVEIESVRETHKIEEEDWNEAFSALDETLPQDQNINVEMVKNVILEKRRLDLIDTKADSFTKEYSDVLNDEFKTTLKGIMQDHPEFTDDDIKAIVKEAISKHTDKQVSDRLSKKIKKPNSKTPATEKEEKSEFDFSDLVDWD